MAAIRADPRPEPSVATSKVTLHPINTRVSLILDAKLACLMNTDPSTAATNGTRPRFFHIATTPARDRVCEESVRSVGTELVEV